jgi:hypothetical protein
VQWEFAVHICSTVEATGGRKNFVITRVFVCIIPHPGAPGTPVLEMGLEGRITGGCSLKVVETKRMFWRAVIKQGN